MADSVRYRVSGDNSVLRFVLYDLWKIKCYWCGRPKDYCDVQIDHIIPQTVKDERLQELLEQFCLPAEFDVHDPRNLAPICSSCNGPGGKGDKDLSHVPVVRNKLMKAERLRPTVIEKVKTFAVPGRVAAALILAKEADLNNPTTRRAFEEHAPAVVQKLAFLDEAKVDYLSFRTVEVQVEDHPTVLLDVDISLDVRARSATTILELVCGSTLEEVLQEPVVDLFQTIRWKIQTAFERTASRRGGVTIAGTPVSYFVRINVDSIGFERTGSFFKFTFGGNFEASLSPSVWQDSWPDGELVERQGDEYVTGTFFFDATWDRCEGGDVDTSECRLNSWDSDAHPLR